MKTTLILLLSLTSVSAQESPSVAERILPPPLPAAKDPVQIFTKGTTLGHVGDNPKNSYRRLVQRTIMLNEPRPAYGAVLTFDDQLTPALAGDSSALEVATDLKKHHARAIFFANVPGNSKKNLSKILNADDPEKAALEFLAKRKTSFVKTIRTLLKIKDDKKFVCEVFNHTAFHQNMKTMKSDSTRFKVCMVGIRFIEKCLDEAYTSERPGHVRSRHFRFPFLHSPTDKATRTQLDSVFTELGLLTLGETQDSKDVLNFSPDFAYEALVAAKNNQRYNPDLKAFGQTEQPIALFHTRSWSRIKAGVLKALDEENKPSPTPTQ